MQLTVKESGPLELSRNIAHPFVKVHFVDTQTCKYLAKNVMRVPAVTNRESASCFLGVEGPEGKVQNKHFDDEANYVLPLCTKLYDLRTRAENSAHWNEAFTVNMELEHLFQPTTIVFFEILDFD